MEILKPHLRHIKSETLTWDPAVCDPTCALGDVTHTKFGNLHFKYLSPAIKALMSNWRGKSHCGAGAIRTAFPEEAILTWSSKLFLLEGRSVAEVREHWLAFGLRQEMDASPCCIWSSTARRKGSVHSLTFRFQPCHHQSIAVNGDYCEEAGKCRLGK